MQGQSFLQFKFRLAPRAQAHCPAWARFCLAGIAPLLETAFLRVFRASRNSGRAAPSTIVFALAGAFSTSLVALSLQCLAQVYATCYARHRSACSARLLHFLTLLLCTLSGTLASALLHGHRGLHLALCRTLPCIIYPVICESVLHAAQPAFTASLVAAFLSFSLLLASPLPPAPHSTALHSMSGMSTILHSLLAQPSSDRVVAFRHLSVAQIQQLQEDLRKGRRPHYSIQRLR